MHDYYTVGTTKKMVETPMLTNARQWSRKSTTDLPIFTHLLLENDHTQVNQTLKCYTPDSLYPEIAWFLIKTNSIFKLSGDLC